MKKIIFSLVACLMFSSVAFADENLVEDLKVLNLTCNQLMNDEASANLMFSWLEKNADITTDEERMEIAEYLDDYCASAPNATFMEAMMAAEE